MDNKKKSKPSIEPLENGPYLVKNLETLCNSKGEAIETNPQMALCRCGGSGTKPFCNGTHAKMGFSSKKIEGRLPDKTDDYSSAELTIHDNRGVCAHSAHCTDDLPSVFILGQEPWINPGGAGADEIESVIKICPSGALSYTRAGSLYKDWTSDPAVKVSKNGPYEVSGGLDINDPDRATPESVGHCTLCRCGGSKNKPFCDGTHWNNGFADEKN